ncbi:unnamed protein product [Diplocarpon coronariae]|uniref:DNA damage-responsive protein 48 n=1 Tax=Diplocarpon coronariae TaxID=2795749 RepID=A0A218YWJ4_9HELO|nr:hypothetical protein B2J93_415 [Marssonina coronariae]
MDFINKLAGGSSNEQAQNQQQGSSSAQNEQSSSSNQEGGGFLSGLGNKLNSAAGGGKESEKNEDYLDKGVDFVQEKFLGQGAQDNESAVEQAKDEQISDFIRAQYKSTTGKDIPIKDKETRFG